LICEQTEHIGKAFKITETSVCTNFIHAGILLVLTPKIETDIS